MASSKSVLVVFMIFACQSVFSLPYLESSKTEELNPINELLVENVQPRKIVVRGTDDVTTTANNDTLDLAAFDAEFQETLKSLDKAMAELDELNKGFKEFTDEIMKILEDEESTADTTATKRTKRALNDNLLSPIRNNLESFLESFDEHLMPKAVSGIKRIVRSLGKK